MIHLQDLLAATGGRVHGAVHADRFAGFAYDSRIAQPGDLFLAVKTARADGHDYIAHACQQGAAGVLCERPPDLGGQPVTCVVVSDVREALTDWARYILRKYAPEVVCITGSAGKTTTKEAVAAVLGARYQVFKNYGSFNDRYGLPIALGQLAPEHQVAVLEIASDHYDEIRELAHIAGPRLGVITAVSAAHTATLGSVEDIALEKGRLVEALPADGWAALNADDPRVRAMAARTRARVIYYGLGPAVRDLGGALHLWAEDIALTAEGTEFTLRVEDATQDATTSNPCSNDLTRSEDATEVATTNPCSNDFSRSSSFRRSEDATEVATTNPCSNDLTRSSSFRRSEDATQDATTNPCSNDFSRSSSFRRSEDATQVATTSNPCSNDLTRSSSLRVRLALLGRHNIFAALAALAVGLVRGVPLADAAAALAALRPLPGRLHPLAGAGGSLLLDDTYNASPAAVLAGLATLRELPARRRIAVLGDMLELGDYEAQGHREVGRGAAGIVDLLVTRGERAQLIAEAAREAGLPADRIVVTYAAQDAIRALQGTLGPGDVALLKGSAEARMEEVTAALLADPADRAQLPRQGPAWERVRLLSPARPTWVEIDLEAIAGNVRRVAEIIGPEVAIMAVLKADAYGHGAVKVARTALNNGARLMGVACLGEALALRQAGIAAPILVLGYTPPWQAREMVLHDVTATLFSLDVARALSRAAVELRGVARAHLKVDTGMGRLGLLPDQAADFVRQARELPGLELEGVFTHFSSADELDRAYTLAQLAAFREVLRAVEEAGVSPRWVHAANSAALLTLPESRFNLVRLGIAMYGLDPSPEVGCPPGFRPALSFKTTIAQVKALPAGSAISYGRAYHTAGPARIAVIPVGYADGFRRGPAHWGEVLVRGRRAPLVGRVCMDQTMIDVTAIPDAREGDEVVLIGQQGADRLTAEDVARRLGTINYEVISEILARVPRVS